MGEEGPRQLPASRPASPCLPGHVCCARLPAPLSCPPQRKIKAAVLQENKGKGRREGGAAHRPWGGGATWVPLIFSLPGGLRTLGFSDATGRGQAGSRSPLVSREVLCPCPGPHLAPISLWGRASVRVPWPCLPRALERQPFSPPPSQPGCGVSEAKAGCRPE